MAFAFNLPHYVRTIRLKRTDALLPLYEAVVNSIQAVRERQAEGGYVEVTIHREGQGSLVEHSEAPLIMGFTIIDNGVGFTDINMASFRMAASDLKESFGGKGIGRFVWLKVFARARVQSTFGGSGEFLTREFVFRPTEEGIHEERVEKAQSHQFQTTVNLEEMLREFAEACRFTTETIARRLLDHCMVYLMQPDCPRIVVRDDEESYRLDTLFQSEVSLHGSRAKLLVNDQAFDVMDLRRKPSAGGKHRLHLCAHSREVITENLSNIVPELQGRLTDDEGSDYFVSSYVLSPYLDTAVNQERTALTFDRPDSLLAGAVTDKELFAEIGEHIRKEFGGAIAEANSEKLTEYSNFITEEAPEFRILLGYTDELRRLPAKLSNEKLRIELFRIKNRLRADLKEEGVRLLAEPAEARSEDEYKEKVAKFAQEWNRLGVSELANYVIHRKVMLDFLETALRRIDGRYQREEAIHKFILPLRVTSDDIEYDQQNLWIIDERLAYHHYLASDKQLRSLAAGTFEGSDRPDLIIFNRSHAFAEEGYPYQSVEIVEFKRPMRDDYDDEDNPIIQVRDYIRRLRTGREVDQHGRLIPITSATAYYAYIICDITPRLAEIAEAEQFIRTPDGMGFFLFHKTYNAVFQIIGFSKLLDDAKKRNNVLFDKLNLPRK